MTNQIRLNGTEVRSRGQEFRNHGMQLETQIHQLDNLMTRLCDEWDGMSSDRFNQQYASLRPSFIEMRELLETLNQQLIASAQIMEETDQQIANKFVR
ncbi:MAG: WXG100 family type VII secretion target [Mycoplasmatales bacterium]